MGPSKTPTKAEKARMARIVELGCVACRKEQRFLPSFGMPAEVHHLLDGGVRRGHAATIALCRWHHRGFPPETWSRDYATEFMGPSLANGSRDFEEWYGDDDELLAYQNALLAGEEGK